MFFVISSISINVKAEEIKSENVELIILFKDNNVDESVKNFIIDEWGTIVENLSQIGGLEVKCTVDLIPNIKSYTTVESI